MREIKFEVFDTHLKTMQKDAHLYHEFVRYLSDDRYIKRQYTGLKDKNGKEIYEGDIISVQNVNNTELFKGTVEFEPTSGYTVNVKKEFVEFTERLQFEVIGNIYENPELLK